MSDEGRVTTNVHRQPVGSAVETFSRRVVLLGASNLTLAFPFVVDHLRTSWHGPLEILAAHGHGRSYGRWSRVLVRELPGIAESGLWAALDARSSSAEGESTSALITDVGNDLLYLAGVDEVACWVETCLQRLQAHNADIVLTLPPLASIERLSAWRYYLMRSVFFPQCRVSPATMRARAIELDAALQELGQRYATRTIPARREWYGFDPIHIRRQIRPRVWREILGAWSDARGPDEVRSAEQNVACPPVWKLRPHQRRMFGRLRSQQQPCWQRDEVGVSLF